MRHSPAVTWHDDPAHFRRPTRRTFLEVGALGTLGLTLGDFLRLRANAGEGKSGKEPAAQACIHIFMPGGMAHQESFDPKPTSPVEYRGDMGVVQTNVEGVVLNECLTKTARLMDKITVCRSMTH